MKLKGRIRDLEGHEDHGDQRDNENNEDNIHCDIPVPIPHSLPYAYYSYPLH